MIQVKDFLFEIGTEELPPKALKKLSQSLLSNVETQLKEFNISFGRTKWFASPRRLSFIINDLAELQLDTEIEKQGPLTKIGFDKDGNPTPAVLGFARSCGTTVDNLSTVDTPKGEKFIFKSIQKGVQTIEILQDILSKSLKQLPIPKMMRWGNSSFEFVRPVHWIVALFGDNVVELELFNKKASNVSYGHRFHSPEAIEITINSYEEKLQNAKVIADWDIRKNLLTKQAYELAKENNYNVILDEDLVEEVNAIVEYPNAMICNFNDEFLRAPQESLISSMQEHQKCFPLVDENGKIVPYFITISNIISQKPELVINGNQKVMNARLADAVFFYDTDIKTPLQEFLPRLESVTFHNKLGNMLQKANRIANVSKKLAILVNADDEQAHKAGLLAKADLISDMVFEFTDLQGIIGKYYALAHNESEIVANAIEQQYWPKYSGAELPKTTVANCVALAEKLDTLVGIFGIGQKPTGNKDPFALRRASIGILRILRDTDLNISLNEIIDIAVESYKSINNIEFIDNVKNEIINFCFDRLKFLYKEEGISLEIFNSVNNVEFSTIRDFNNRVKAVSNFNKTQFAKSLVASNKRVSNILSKNSKSDIISYDMNLCLNTSSEYEIILANSINDIEENLEKVLFESKYIEAFEILSTLDENINLFFDNVMVMDQNSAIRSNRIALLNKLHKLFLSVADISKL